MLCTEHRHSLRPSVWFSLALVIETVAECKSILGAVLESGLNSAVYLSMTGCALRIIIIWLQDRSKKGNLAPEFSRRSSQATGGLLGISLWLVFGPILASSFASWVVDFNQLDVRLSPRVLHEELKEHWPPTGIARELQPSDLLKSCLRAWKGPLIQMLLFRAAIIGFHCVHPFLLSRFVVMIDPETDHPANKEKRLELLIKILCFFVTVTLTRTASGYSTTRFITRIRGGLTAHLLCKVHNLVESDTKRAKANSLLNTDISGIAQGIPECLEVLSATIELTANLWMLLRMIHTPAITVFANVIITTFAGYGLARVKMSTSARWTELATARISQTSAILQQLVPIRMMGLGPPVAAMLCQLHRLETDAYKVFTRWRAVSYFVLLFSDLVTPAVVLVSALIAGTISYRASSAEILPIVAVIYNIQRTTIGILYSFPRISTVLGCFSRIQKFLCLREHHDSRLERSSETDAADDPNGVRTNFIRFHYADIVPAPSEPVVVSRVNLELEPGTITAMLGASKSGKSSMLRAILGRTEIVAGSVLVGSEDIGYCDENVWLQNSTLRDNVIGSLDYEPEKFRRAIRAVFLDEDIEWLPGGENFVVGVKGENLSQGQRQRVGIARIAYAMHPIILLDDIFRLLDANTAICILHQLCGRRGILREAGCTVVLVTYLPQCIEVVDQLMFLDGHGSAVLDRTYRAPNITQEMMVAIAPFNKHVPYGQEKKEQDAIRRFFASDLPTSDSASVQRGPFTAWGAIGSFVGSAGRTSAAMGALVVASYATAELVSEVYVQVGIGQFAPDSYENVIFLVLPILACGLGASGLWVMHGRASPQAADVLHRHLVQTTIYSTLDFVSKADIAGILNICGQDMATVIKSFPDAVMRTIHCDVSVLQQMLVIALCGKYMHMTIPIILVCFYQLRERHVVWSRELEKLDRDYKAPMYAHFEEVAAGVTYIDAFNTRQLVIQRGLRLLEQCQKSHYGLCVVQDRVKFATGIIAAATVSMLATLALFVPNFGHLRIVGYAYHSILMFGWTMKESVGAWTALNVSSEAIGRILEFTQGTPQEYSPPESHLHPNWPFSGRIEIANVYAQYEAGTDTTPALRNFSLHAEPGQTIGVSGRYGSGKSSLLMLLLGFIRYEGRVEIDGVNIASIPPELLRSRLITITQEQVTFDETIRKNLLPFQLDHEDLQTPRHVATGGPTDVEIEQLLKRLHIWRHLISWGRLDAQMKHVQYSESDIQLLCVARAILRQRETGCRVVLIDEALDKLEPEAYKIAQQVMKEAFVNCTVLMVSHRPSGLQDCDKRMHLRRGTISVGNDDDVSDSSSDEGSIIDD